MILICAFAIITDCERREPNEDSLASAVQSVEIHFAQWIKTRSKSSLRKAILAQRKIVSLKPQDFEARYSLANLVYMQSTSDEDAKQLAETALSLQPSSAKALKLLGRIHVQLGDTGQGLPFLLRSLELSPVDPECWYKAGAVYFEKGDLIRAASCFKTAAHISGDSFYLLSAAHTLQKLSHSRAFSFYWAAVRANPTMLDAWNDLTFALSATRSHKRAEQTARRAFSLQPTAAHLFTVANSIMGQGHYARAVSQYEQAVALDPRNMDILHNLAFTLLLDDRPVPAAEASLAAVEALLHGNGTTTDPSGVPSLGPTFVVGLANALRRAALLHPPASDAAAHLERLAVAVLAPLRQPPTPRDQVAAARSGGRPLPDDLSAPAGRVARLGCARARSAPPARGVVPAPACRGRGRRRRRASAAGGTVGTHGREGCGTRSVHRACSPRFPPPQAAQR